jgi:hypothetical protein
MLVPMQRMSREEARAFAARWKLVADAELEELRGTSAADKFAALAKLVDSARDLGWRTTDPGEIEQVRDRWNRLVAIYRG